MYLFKLPPVIPAAGTAGGPPLPENYHDFGNSSIFGDMRLVYLNCIHNPQQLQSIWDHFIEVGKEEQKKQQNLKPKK
jgi:hypothetical protein